MYQKYYDRWNLEKQKLEQTSPNYLPFHEREIWWCSLGVNLGDEQDGKNDFFERPILVLKKFNISGDTVSCVILSQLRLISVKRFRRFIRKISPLQFREIKQKLTELIQ